MNEPYLAILSPAAATTNRRVGRAIAVALIACVAFSLVVAVLFIPGLGFARLYHVPTNAMARTIVAGDCVYASALPYLLHSPRRGDIVVFRTDGIFGIPQSPHSPIFFKRLIGLPGKELSVRDGEILVHREQAPELANLRYSPPGRIGHYLESEGSKTLVPNGTYFVVGDNLRNSYDSRYWGGVPIRNVTGRAMLRVWPLTRIGLL